MTTLGLTAVLNLALIATGAETYEDAHRENAQTGRPMVVLVGADWCPACQVMKNSILPQIRERGVLRKVAFALVNLDQERELGAQLTENGPIPQLVMYRQTSAGWRLRRLIGGHDVKAVEEFIQEGLKASESVQAEPKPAPQPSEKTPPAKDTAAQGVAGTKG